MLSAKKDGVLMGALNFEIWDRATDNQFDLAALLILMDGGFESNPSKKSAAAHPRRSLALAQLGAFHVRWSKAISNPYLPRIQTSTLLPANESQTPIWALVSHGSQEASKKARPMNQKTTMQLVMHQARQHEAYSSALKR